MAKKGPALITGDETKHHLQFIEAARLLKNREERAKPLSEGLLLFGRRFISTFELIREKAVDLPVFEEMYEQVLGLFGNWLEGNQLTERADENDRRALMAYDLLESSSGSSIIKWAAAIAILKLPEGHQLKDLKLARKAVQEYLQDAYSSGQIHDQLSALATLLEYDLESPEQLDRRVAEGMTLLERGVDSEYRRRFLFQVIAYYTMKAIDARDQDRPEEMQEAANAAKQAYGLLQANHGSILEETGNLLALGLLLMLSGDEAGAADILGQVRTTDGITTDALLLAAFHEGRLLSRLGEHARALDVLLPIIPDLEEKYLTCVSEEEAYSAGKEFTELMLNCAVAAIKQGDWIAALGHVEHSKSLRLRYRASLRQSDLADRVLQFENLLNAATRGVSLPDGPPVKKSSDWLGVKVTAQANLLEAYRELRATLPPKAMEQPSVAEIGATLMPDEAAVFFAIVSGMTWLVVICEGDIAEPSWKWMSEEWSRECWRKILFGENKDGWLYAVGVPENDIDRNASLEHTLQELDAWFGQQLAKWLAEKGIRHLTIVPHRFLHFIPFWALPSLAQFDCLIAPSASHLVQARRSHPPAGTRAVVIGNPTLDLPLTSAELGCLREHLRQLPMKTLEREAATESAIRAAAPGCGLLHFCGHGVSNPTRPMLSGLLVYPELAKVHLPVTGPEADPLEWAAGQVTEWQKVDDNTCRGTVPGLGRLEEIRPSGCKSWQRRLEYSLRGSLLGYYHSNRLLRLAELWTVGDIMGEDSLAGVQLAFLSACDSGVGNLDFEVDEYSGLPAALQLAGVSSVVATLWPVSDVLTVLYVELFYSALAEAATPGGRVIDVPALLQIVRTRLRGLTREAAANLLREIRARTTDPTARFRLEAYAAKLRQGEELPFEHPYQWAAFYVSGARYISLVL